MKSHLDFLAEMWVYILVVIFALLVVLGIGGLLDMDDTKQVVPLSPPPSQAGSLVVDLHP